MQPRNLPAPPAESFLPPRPRFSGEPTKEPEVFSVFQPIFSVAHKRAVGHEALVRGRDAKGMTLGAKDVLNALAEAKDENEIERACVQLHLSEFVRQGREGWLFLNVSPEALAERETVKELFGRWLLEAGLQGHRVVIEIVETKAISECALATAIEGLRELGCWIAIDDFGAGESNFERIWRIRPNIVKLDREMLVEACRHDHVRRLMPGIVSLLHEAGCLVVLEGIETDEQAMIAMESDVDFVQGYRFSKPSVVEPQEAEAREVFGLLSLALRGRMAEKGRQEEAFLQGYLGRFEECANIVSLTGSFREGSALLIQHPGVQRVYLLSDQGVQVGDNLEGRADRPDAMAFGPFLHSEGADWFRRAYFQRAIARPGVIQTSRRYLSVRDARPCVTMSVALQVKNELRVLCVDLDHDL